MENKEMIELVVKCVFAMVSVLLTGYLIPWFKTYINSEKMDSLMIFIEKSVEAAEKLYTPEEWEQKKAYVRNLAVQRMNDLGIAIDAESLNAIIEGFVKAVKG